MAMVLGARRPWSGKKVWRRRSAAPWLDSWYGDEEEEAAELVVLSDLHGKVSTSGELPRGGVHVGLAARVSVRGEKEGEEEQQVEGVALTTMGGLGERGGSGGGATATVIVAAVSSLSPQEQDADREGPLSVI